MKASRLQRGTAFFSVLFGLMCGSGCKPKSDDALLSPIFIATPDVSDGMIDVAYSDILGTVGGVGPFSWNVSSGTLPTGLTLNPSTGEISGTPSAVGGPTAFTV